MRRQWIHRNADVGTIEARDEMDDDGSEAPPAGGFIVPSWAKFITRIRASAALDGAAVGNGIIAGYLEGGLDNGDARFHFLIAGSGGQVATGTQNAVPAYESPPLNVPIAQAKEGGTRIRVFSGVFGDAENDTEASISIQVSDSPNPGGAVWSRGFMADVDTVDTSTSLTGAFLEDTNPPTAIPSAARELAWVSGAFGFDQAADGTYACKVVIQAGPIMDQQDITIGAGGSIAGQAGSDEGWMTVLASNAEVYNPVTGGDLAGKVRGEQMGDDAGSGQVAAVLWFR